ncbi:MAG: hypothetical protein ACKV2T_00240 [Kofleriaceae bacterium]
MGQPQPGGRGSPELAHRPGADGPVTRRDPKGHEDAGEKKKRVRQRDLLIDSDLPVATGIAPWERELLLPIVKELLDDLTSVGNDGQGKSITNERGADDVRLVTQRHDPEVAED